MLPYTQCMVCVGFMEWQLYWEVTGGCFEKEIIFAQSAAGGFTSCMEDQRQGKLGTQAGVWIYTTTVNQW